MNDPVKSSLAVPNNSSVKVIKCALCSDKWAVRLSLWSATCELCSKIISQQYNEKDIRLQAIAHTRNPQEHEGEKLCTACGGDNLVILYDEVDDEWLHCGGCRRFKQLLRCWNMYANTMMNSLEKPMTRREVSVTLLILILSLGHPLTHSLLDWQEDCSEAEKNLDFLTHEISSHSSDIDLESFASSIVEHTGTAEMQESSESNPYDGRKSEMQSLPPLIKNSINMNI